MQTAQPRRQHRPWIPEEMTIVLYGWGEEPLDVTADRVGRSVRALRHTLFRQRGTGGARLDRVTFDEIAREVGRSWLAVRRAAKACEVHVVRTRLGRGAQNLVALDDVEVLIEWLERPTVGVVARRIGVSRARAYRVAAELGIGGRLDEQQAAALQARLETRP